MIRFGPCGIPLSCKGRTQKDGIEDVHTLGLSAMEVQFVRVNLSDRYAADEDYGHTPDELLGELVVDIVRKGGREKLKTPIRQTKIEKGDILKVLNSGIAKDYKMLGEIGELARDLDIQISIHSPYYMDLVGVEERAERSLENLRYTGLIGQGLGATVISTNVGLFNSLTSEQAIEVLVKRIKELLEWFRKQKITVPIGLEVAGKQQVFGSLDDIITVCKRVPDTLPVVNFAHHHAREGGILKRKEDFQELFDKLAVALKTDSFYTHFSGVEHEGGNEKRYTPIKKGDLRFEPLAECLLETDYAVSVVSDSPLLEHDAMYMKVILERVQLKRELRESKREPTVGARDDEGPPPTGPPVPVTPARPVATPPVRAPPVVAPAKGKAGVKAGPATPAKPAPKAETGKPKPKTLTKVKPAKAKLKPAKKPAKKAAPKARKAKKR